MHPPRPSTLPQYMTDSTAQPPWAASPSTPLKSTPLIPSPHQPPQSPLAYPCPSPSTGPPPTLPPTAAPPPDFSWVSNHCGGRAAMGLFGGGVMGLGMGVFLGAMSDMTPPVTVYKGREVPLAPFKEQMRAVMRQTGEKSLYWCRNFAFITGVFSGSECVIEKARGRTDIWNATLSGCVTGAAIQAKQGPQAACMGCVGFAAFSIVIDKVMGH